MKSGLHWKKNTRKYLVAFVALLGLTSACAIKQMKLSTLAQLKYLQAQGKHEKAISGLKSYLSKNSKTPYAPEAAYLIGESYMQLNKFDKAEDAYKDLVYDYSKSPYAALGWRRLAELEQKEGRFKEAIENYQHSMQIYNAEFNLERCTLYIARIYEKDLKDLDAALTEYKKLLRELKNPRIASDAFLSTAKIHLTKNNKEEARSVLEKLLEKYPESTQAEEAKKLLEDLKK